MATAEVLNRGHGATSGYAGSREENALSFAAMIGAAVGAFTGAAVGADAAVPVIWGGFGTMLGSGLAAGGWFLCARLFNRR